MCVGSQMHIVHQHPFIAYIHRFIHNKRFSTRPQLALFLVSIKSLVNASVCFSCSSLSELKSTGTAHHFAFLLNSTDYRVLRMDEDHDRMYVGSKDYILSLDLNDINKEPLIVSKSVILLYTYCTRSNKPKTHVQ